MHHRAFWNHYFSNNIASLPLKLYDHNSISPHNYKGWVLEITVFTKNTVVNDQKQTRGERERKINVKLNANCLAHVVNHALTTTTISINENEDCEYGHSEFALNNKKESCKMLGVHI